MFVAGEDALLWQLAVVAVVVVVGGGGVGVVAAAIDGGGALNALATSTGEGREKTRWNKQERGA